MGKEGGCNPRFWHWGLNSRAKSRSLRAMRTSRLGLVLCVALSAACKKPNSNEGAPSGGTAPAEQRAPGSAAIRIGATLPLTAGEPPPAASSNNAYHLSLHN